MTDTRAWLADVKARCEKATSCPTCDGSGQVHIQHPLKPFGVIMSSVPCNNAIHDIPRLLALVERLKAYVQHQRNCPYVADLTTVEHHRASCFCGYSRVWEEP
jgi:hypothetical protein